MGPDGLSGSGLAREIHRLVSSLVHFVATFIIFIYLMTDALVVYVCSVDCQ